MVICYEPRVVHETPGSRSAEGYCRDTRLLSKMIRLWGKSKEDLTVLLKEGEYVTFVGKGNEVVGILNE